MRKPIDLAGQRFGRIVVQPICERRPRASHSQTNAWWKCACDCGGESWVRQDRLKCGETKSCGCLRDGNSRRRGEAARILNRLGKDHRDPRWQWAIERGAVSI